MTEEKSAEGTSDAVRAFVSLAVRAASAGALKKLTFSRPKPGTEAFKTATSEYRLASGELMIKLEYLLDDGKNIRKNVPLEDAEKIITELSSSYKQGNLILDGAEAQYLTSKKGKTTLSGIRRAELALENESVRELGGADREKNYFWHGGEGWLIALGISDKNGRVHDKRQSKFRQINRFTELLDDVYGELPETGTLNVCDLCCGKSYLSFAVYEYLTKIRKRDVVMLCVDRKRDVMEFCKGVSEQIGAEGLIFKAADIADNDVYDTAFGENARTDLVVSLHACDTATDLVLRRAVTMGARVILSTPCCHHELNGKIKCRELSFLTSHSMLSRKLTDAVTDGLRVMMLEAEGYRTSTVELIDPDETPKNLMIRAVKRRRFGEAERAAMTAEYNDAIAFLGLDGSYYDIYK